MKKYELLYKCKRCNAIVKMDVTAEETVALNAVVDGEAPNVVTTPARIHVCKDGAPEMGILDCFGVDVTEVKGEGLGLVDKPEA